MTRKPKLMTADPSVSPESAIQARDTAVRDLEQRMRELVFALAGDPNGPETLTLRDINDLFKVLSAGADYLRDLLAALAQRESKLIAAEAEVEHQRGHKDDYAQMLEVAEARIRQLQAALEELQKHASAMITAWDDDELDMEYAGFRDVLENLRTALAGSLRGVEGIRGETDEKEPDEKIRD